MSALNSSCPYLKLWVGIQWLRWPLWLWGRKGIVSRAGFKIRMAPKGRLGSFDLLRKYFSYTYVKKPVDGLRIKLSFNKYLTDFQELSKLSKDNVSSGALTVLEAKKERKNVDDEIVEICWIFAKIWLRIFPRIMLLLLLRPKKLSKRLSIG